jgi:diacylglycerol O-acyltransferase
MSKLSILDALFLWAETPEMTAHVAGLQIYQLPEGKDSAWLQELMETLRGCKPGKPFDQRLKFRPGRVPELIDDTEFDIDYHLRRTVLPSPGEEEQLRNVVARLHGHPMDRDRPLWEFHLIEGLAGGRFAFYIKIHHAICDGATFAKWMSQSTGTSAEASTPPIWATSRRARGGSQISLLQSLQESLQAPVDAVREGGEMSRGLVQLVGRILRQRFIERNSDVALPLSGPITAINREVSASRNVAFCRFSVDELKAMGRPFKATLNDVLLAICDAALRRYLGEQDQVPESPLVAFLPVNLRLPGEEREGNFVSSLQVKLGGTDQSPTERLKAVARSVKTTKALYSGVPMASTQIYTFSVAGLAAVGQALRLTGLIPPPLNLIISNVPGPRETRYFEGARLEEIYPISGVAPMTALNVTVYSYAGTLFVGLTAARRTMPHVEDLKLCLEEIYDEFKKELLP